MQKGQDRQSKSRILEACEELRLKILGIALLQFYRLAIEFGRREKSHSWSRVVMAGNLSGRGRKPGAITGGTFRHRVAERIRSRRLELQLRAEDTAAVVASHLGKTVSVQTWYHWEKGEHPFDIDVLPAIASALKCDPRDLLP